MVADALAHDTPGVAQRMYVELLKRCLTRCFEDGLSNEPYRTGKQVHPDADSMIGLVRMDNIVECVETVLADEVPGDLVETGVWRGGACILMAGLLAAHGVSDRRVWLADSFAGFPEIDPERWPQDAELRGVDFEAFIRVPIAVSQDEVRERFSRYGLLSDQVRFLPGFFADTLPTAPIGQIAVLRLDGDLYQSTHQAMDALYERLSPGGFCIVDDYLLFPQCRQAVDDYRQDKGITDPIEQIDWTGVYWRKSA